MQSVSGVSTNYVLALVTVFFRVQSVFRASLIPCREGSRVARTAEMLDLAARMRSTFQLQLKFGGSA